MTDAARDGHAFEVENVLNAGGRTYILSRWLSPEIDFALTPQSTLADVPIEEWLDIPRMAPRDGPPRGVLFAFCLRRGADASGFVIGETVILRP